MIGTVGPAALEEGALARLEAVRADRDVGERPAQHLDLRRDRTGYGGQPCLDGGGDVRADKEIPLVGKAKFLVEVHDLRVSHIHAAATQDVDLHRGIDDVFILQR